MSTKVIVPVVAVTAIIGLGFLAHRRYQAYMEDVIAKAAQQVMANRKPRGLPHSEKEVPNGKS